MHRPPLAGSRKAHLASASQTRASPGIYWVQRLRGCEVQFLANLLPYRAGHKRSRGQSGLVFGHVQMRFVQRKWLDHVCMAFEDLPHTLRHGTVGAKSGTTKMSVGHKRSARRAGMVERTPKDRASYDAAQTTERLPFPCNDHGLAA